MHIEKEMSMFTTQHADGPLTIKPVKMSADSKKGMEKVKEPLHNTGSFFYLLVGPPGASKTTTMLSLLLDKNAFARKFEQCHIFSPSLATIDDLPLPKDRLHPELDLKLIEKLITSIPTGERLLLCFDDMVANLPGGKDLKIFVRMIYNRRHLAGKGGGVAVMMISQKLTGIPRQLRCAADGIFYYYTANEKEIKCFYDEFVSMPYGAFLKMLDFAWSDKYSFLFGRLDRRNQDRWYRNFEAIPQL